MLLTNENNSGYDQTQLARIEDAFVYGGVCDSLITDEGNFKGLMAVIDVLQEIHECSEEEVKEAKKTLKRNYGFKGLP